MHRVCSVFVQRIVLQYLYLLLLVLPLPVGCARSSFRTVVFEVVSAENPSSPLDQVEIMVDDKSVGVTNAAGRLEWRLPLGEVATIKIMARDKAPQRTYLPIFKSYTVPASSLFFSSPEEHRVPIAMFAPQPVAAVETTASEVSAITEEIIQPEPVAARRILNEADLPPEVNPLPPLVPTPLVAAEGNGWRALPDGVNNLTKNKLNLVSNVFTKKPEIGVRVGADDELVQLEVLADARPLANAQVLLGRLATQTFTYLGNTDESGLFQTKLAGKIRGEVVLVRHDCCKSSLMPLTSSAGLQKLRVELPSVPGVEVMAQSFAFGILRNFAGIEVRGSGGNKLEVAGAHGLAIVNYDKSVHPLSLFCRDCVPDVFALDLKGLGDKDKSANAMIVYANSRKPPRPNVGIVEASSVSDDGAQAAHWRRFRRELVGRLMQETTFRPVIESDVKKLTEAIQISPARLLQAGWEFTLINPDLDFVLNLERLKPNEFALKLVHRSGSVVMERSFSTAGADVPERVGADAYRALLEAIPFEGAVIGYSGKEALLTNLGTTEDRGLKVGQNFVVMQGEGEGINSLPQQLVAVGHLSTIDKHGAVLTLTTMRPGFSAAKVRLGARVARLSGEEAVAKSKEGLLATTEKIVR